MSSPNASNNRLPERRKTFPERLREKANDKDSPEICWQPGGEGIIVTDQAKVEADFMKSFTRTMHAWGFVKGNAQKDAARKKSEEYWYHKQQLFTKRDEQNDLQAQRKMRDNRKCESAPEPKEPEAKNVAPNRHTSPTEPSDITDKTDDTSSGSETSSGRNLPTSQPRGQDAPAAENHTYVCQNLCGSDESTTPPAPMDLEDWFNLKSGMGESGGKCVGAHSTTEDEIKQESGPATESSRESQGCKRQRTCNINSMPSKGSEEESEEESSADTAVSRLFQDSDDGNPIRDIMGEDSPSTMVWRETHQAPHQEAATRFWNIVESFIREHCSLDHDSRQESNTNDMNGSSFNSLIGMTNAVEDLDFLLRISRFTTQSRTRFGGDHGNGGDGVFNVHAFVWDGFERYVHLPGTSAWVEAQKYWLKKKLQDLLLAHDAEEAAMPAAVEALSRQLEGLQRISTGRRKRQAQLHTQYRGDDDDDNGDIDNDNNNEAGTGRGGSNFDGSCDESKSDHGRGCNGGGGGGNDDDETFDGFAGGGGETEARIEGGRVDATATMSTVTSKNSFFQNKNAAHGALDDAARKGTERKTLQAPSEEEDATAVAANSRTPEDRQILVVWHDSSAGKDVENERDQNVYNESNNNNDNNTSFVCKTNKNKSKAATVVASSGSSCAVIQMTEENEADGEKNRSSFNDDSDSEEDEYDYEYSDNDEEQDKNKNDNHDLCTCELTANMKEEDAVHVAFATLTIEEEKTVNSDSVPVNASRQSDPCLHSTKLSYCPGCSGEPIDEDIDDGAGGNVGKRGVDYDDDNDDGDDENEGDDSCNLGCSKEATSASTTAMVVKNPRCYQLSPKDAVVKVSTDNMDAFVKSTDYGVHHLLSNKVSRQHNFGESRRKYNFDANYPTNSEDSAYGDQQEGEQKPPSGQSMQQESRFNDTTNVSASPVNSLDEGLQPQKHPIWPMSPVISLNEGKDHQNIDKDEDNDDDGDVSSFDLASSLGNDADNDDDNENGNKKNVKEVAVTAVASPCNAENAFSDDHFDDIPDLDFENLPEIPSRTVREDTRGKDRQRRKSLPGSRLSIGTGLKYVKVWRNRSRQRGDDNDSDSSSMMTATTVTDTVATTAIEGPPLFRGFWKTGSIPRMKTSRGHFAAVSLREEGKIVVLGGMDSSDFSAVESISTVQNSKKHQWIDMQQMTRPRYLFGAAVVTTWLPSTTSTSLPLSVDSTCSVGRHLCHHIVVAGGSHTSLSPTDSAEVWNLSTDQWRDLPPLQVKRTRCAVTSLYDSGFVAGHGNDNDDCGGRVYVVGGHGGGERHDSVEWLDLAAFQTEPRETVGWRYLPSKMKRARALLAAVMVQSPDDSFAGEDKSSAGDDTRDGDASLSGVHLVVLGGETKKEGATNTVESFDFGTGQWQNFPPMTTRRKGCAAVVVGCYIYVVGGNDENWNALATAEHFDFRTKRWTRLSSKMSVPRNGCAAVVVREDHNDNQDVDNDSGDTLVPRHCLVVMGGKDGSKYHSSTEVLKVQ